MPGHGIIIATGVNAFCLIGGQTPVGAKTSLSLISAYMRFTASKCAGALEEEVYHAPTNCQGSR